MKNGDPRSPGWIALRMKTFVRSNRNVELLTMLVDLQPISMAVIESWTDEQCMLATDWIGAEHFSASDNNNRVPACPDFLQAYRNG
ncbi:MAG: hypothetical protein ABI790_05300 [Betaproteobacteria bacterium]